MRPRKTIIVFSRSGFHAATLKFLLETRGKYRVQVVPDAESIVYRARCGRVDLLLAELDGTNQEANELARQVKAVSTLPVVLFSRSVVGFDWGSHADCFITEPYCNSEEILLRVGILIRRKRGPKKKMVEAMA